MWCVCKSPSVIACNEITITYFCVCAKSISIGYSFLEDLQYAQNFRKEILPDSAWFFSQIFEGHIIQNRRVITTKATKAAALVDFWEYIINYLRNGPNKAKELLKYIVSFFRNWKNKYFYYSTKHSKNFFNILGLLEKTVFY